MKFIACFAVVFGFVRCQEEICCPGLRCFSDAPPFDHLPLPSCPDLDHPNVEDKTPNFNLFTMSNRNQSLEITRTIIPSAYDGSKRTVFLMHGWLGNRNTQWCHEFKDAFFNNNFDYNVIIVGWGGGAQTPIYSWAASNTRVTGAESALIASNLISQRGANATNMWCIGHSLGAHACGHMGKNLRIGRVTGLDPAGGLFDGFSSAAGLASTDGDFVDSMMTDRWAAGTIEGDRGHANFFPNDGEDMPGCPDDGCDHQRCHRYFLESINPACRFNARQICTDVDDIPGSCGSCGSEVCQVMGEPAGQDGRRGMFRLTTNEQSPYCQG